MNIIFLNLIRSKRNQIIEAFAEGFWEAKKQGGRLSRFAMISNLSPNWWSFHTQSVSTLFALMAPCLSRRHLGASLSPTPELFLPTKAHTDKGIISATIWILWEDSFLASNYDAKESSGCPIVWWYILDSRPVWPLKKEAEDETPKASGYRRRGIICQDRPA